LQALDESIIGRELDGAITQCGRSLISTIALLLLVRRQLQKQRARHISSVIMRDSLRSEMSKQRAAADDAQEKQDQLKIDIDVLNTMIGRAEEQMIQQRKRYEEEIQRRNER